MCKFSYRRAFGLLAALGLSAGLRAQDRPQLVWQAQVDGTAILRVAGKRLSVQIRDGAPVDHQKFHFSDALPQTQQEVRVEVLEGRGYVHVVDRPSIENNYTLSVSIEDRQPGSSFYSIALYWDASGNAFEQGAEKTDRVTWKGRVAGSAVISCHQQTCISAAEQGASVADEHYKFSRPLPERDSEVRLEDPQGRGDVGLIEQPRQRNNYTARVSIRDPQSGAGEYAFTLLWNRSGSKTTKESAQIPDAASRGFRWSGTVDGRVRVTLKGGASFSEVLGGAPLSGERGEILRPLPARADLMPAIRKLQGRGRVAIIETPSQKNNYSLIFEIDDPEPGADYYEIELDWPAAGDISQFSGMARGFADRSFGGGFVQDEFHHQCGGHRDYFGCGGGSVLFFAAANAAATMMYQLGWSTLPGLRGLSCSDFRGTATAAPDNERGVAVEFATDAERDDFVRRLEEHFAARRFTNAADAFDSVKAFVVEHAAKKS